MAEARRWLGVRWHHQGYVRAGCDCVGLVRGVGAATGALVVDEELARPFLGYPRHPWGGRLLKALDTFMTRVPLEGARPGDVLLFAFEGAPQHLGILTEGRSIVHADERIGRVVESAVEPRFRVSGAWRFPDLEDA